MRAALDTNEGALGHCEFLAYWKNGAIGCYSPRSETQGGSVNVLAHSGSRSMFSSAAMCVHPSFFGPRPYVQGFVVSTGHQGGNNDATQQVPLGSIAGLDAGLRRARAMRNKNMFKEDEMATYVMLFNFTQQGIEKVKQLSARGEAAKKLIRELGGEVQSYYMVLGGEFDTLFILEAPSDEKVAEMALAIALAGNVRTRTHRLFNEEELARITSSLP